MIVWHDMTHVPERTISMKPIEVADRLFLIPLDQDIPGFTSFIGGWLYKSGNGTFLVDVGPSASVPTLLKALDALGIKRLDAILLTHIHLDHAGGIGDIALSYPETPILCHRAGIPHLIDPTRLWEGTIKTLGSTGKAYGRIKPVAESRLVDAGHYSSNAVTPFITPGHSSHHVSYKIEEYLFAGETGGVFLSLPSGQEYMRPATPPKFFLETAINSIDLLLEIKPSIICYGHFGTNENAMEMLKIHRQQLLLWEEVIDSEMKNNTRNDFADICMDRLFLEDPLLEGFSYLDEDAKERERGFLFNSIKGFEGHLQRKRMDKG